MEHPRKKRKQLQKTKMRTFLIHKQKPFQTMKTTNHTPGPEWVKFKRKRKSRLSELKKTAQEMQDALQAICDAFGDQESLLIEQCKAALAKAKGEA
jgi:hypothetical protein